MFGHKHWLLKLSYPKLEQQRPTQPHQAYPMPITTAETVPTSTLQAEATTKTATEIVPPPILMTDNESESDQSELSPTATESIVQTQTKCRSSV